MRSGENGSVKSGIEWGSGRDSWERSIHLFEKEAVRYRQYGACDIWKVWVEWERLIGRIGRVTYGKYGLSGRDL